MDDDSAGVDVIIVGAGPTGLMLAGDLAAAGVATTILERRTQESNLTRAFGVHARTLEQFDARGIADDLIRTGTPISTFRLFGRITVDFGTLPSRFPFLLVTPQYEVERILRERALRLGATLVTGAEVHDASQDPHGVRVRTTDGQEFRAAYAVGTDGAHSRIRHALNLPFPGTSVVRSLMLADVRFADPPTQALAINADGSGFALVAPFGDGWFRVIAWDRANPQPDDVPVTFDEIRGVVRRILGTDYGMRDPRWTSRFHCDERQVPHYRVGRIFLAGDAAHIHSPAGGQGMNTGIQDATNLSWRLAAAVRGWAPDGLLDGYESERHPVGRLVLRASGAIIRAAMARPRLVRAARNLIGGTLLSVSPIANRMIGVVSGIGISYPPGRGAHRLVGRRAPDVPTIDGSRLYEVLRSGTFVLLGPPAVGAIAAHWAHRVRVATSADAAAPIMLVRPDGYVAWAADLDGVRAVADGDSAEHSEPTGRGFSAREEATVREALIAWCGPARTDPPAHRRDSAV